MTRPVSAFVAGSLFGLGLLVSQMTNPAKVLAFLDVFGDWDPSLAFVMGGALLVTAVGYRFVLRREAPRFADGFRLPGRTDLDARLVGGAALFGMGWGLVGLCPGPALSSLSFGGMLAAVFTVTMVASMWLTKRLVRD